MGSLEVETPTKVPNMDISDINDKEEKVSKDTPEISTKYVPQDAKDIYRNVVEKSPYIAGDENALVPTEEIQWLDLSKIQEGMTFFQEYFAQYAIIAVLGMITVSLAVKRISTVIFRAEGELSPQLFFRRFFNKLMGVQKFFNVLLTPDEARKQFYRVRKLHALAAGRHKKIGDGAPLPEVLVWSEEPWMGELATAVRKDMEQIPTNPETNKCLPHLSYSIQTAISQFDLVYLTASFFGPVWLRPDLYGLTGHDDPTLKAFVHVWAVIARLLGVRDEFNIYIEQDEATINRIVNEVYVTSVKDMDAVMVHLQGVTCTGVREYIPLFTQRSAICLAIEMLGCERTDSVWQVMSRTDKLYYWFLKTIFWLTANVRIIRLLLNMAFSSFLKYTNEKVIVEARKEAAGKIVL